MSKKDLVVVIDDNGNEVMQSDIVKYCQDEILNYHRQKDLIALKIENGELLVCPICRELVRPEHMKTARFDLDIQVCEQCRIDGN